MLYLGCHEPLRSSETHYHYNNCYFRTTTIEHANSQLGNLIEGGTRIVTSAHGSGVAQTICQGAKYNQVFQKTNSNHIKDKDMCTSAVLAH